MIRPGLVSDAEAAELNRLIADVSRLNNLRVAGSELQIHRGPSNIVIESTSQPPEPDPLDGSAVFVGLVHVTARELDLVTGQWKYTVRAVDRSRRVNQNAAGVLHETRPAVQYGGVYESSNRIQDVDPVFSVSDPFGNASQEIPLYLDSKGFYSFTIDQNADGDVTPDPGTDESRTRVGWVSDVDQVMGDGVKGFRRSVSVNLSRNSFGTFLTTGGTILPPTFRVLSDGTTAYANSFRVFGGSNGNADEPSVSPPTFVPGGGFLPGVPIPAAGAALGSRKFSEQARGFPLTVDGSVYTTGAYVFGGPFSANWLGSDTIYGNLAGQFRYISLTDQAPQSQGIYYYSAAVWAIPIDGVDPANGTHGLPTFSMSGLNGDAAFCLQDQGTNYRGCNLWAANVTKPGGGFYTFYFHGGLLVRVEDENGTVAAGMPPVGVAPPGLNGNPPIGAAPPIGAILPGGIGGAPVPIADGGLKGGGDGLKTVVVE